MCPTLGNLVSRSIPLLFSRILCFQPWSKTTVLQGLKPPFPTAVDNEHFKPPQKEGPALKPTSSKFGYMSRPKLLYLGPPNSILRLTTCFWTFVASPSMEVHINLQSWHGCWARLGLGCGYVDMMWWLIKRGEWGLEKRHQKQRMCDQQRGNWVRTFSVRKEVVNLWSQYQCRKCSLASLAS